MGHHLPDIHKNPFEIEESTSSDAFTAERMVNVLKDSRFFRDLDAAVLETLPQHAKFLNVPNGGVLFRQGDPAKGCYIIVSGKVGFYAGSTSGTPRQPATEPNEQIPEAARRMKTFEGGAALWGRLWGHCTLPANQTQNLAFMDETLQPS